MEFYLLRFDHVVDDGATGPVRSPLDLWKWQALQIRNYMLYLIDHHGFKPKYYCPWDPDNHISILARHVCRFYGIKMANMLCDNIFICDMYSITECFDAVGPVKESMLQDALKDPV